ncbi:MAG: hypothetical protein AAB262_05085, partial [Elusimicrobiota bacterium]
AEMNHSMRSLRRALLSSIHAIRSFLTASEDTAVGAGTEEHGRRGTAVEANAEPFIASLLSMQRSLAAMHPSLLADQLNALNGLVQWRPDLYSKLSQLAFKKGLREGLLDTTKWLKVQGTRQDGSGHDDGALQRIRGQLNCIMQAMEGQRVIHHMTVFRPTLAFMQEATAALRRTACIEPHAVLSPSTPSSDVAFTRRGGRGGGDPPLPGSVATLHYAQQATAICRVTVEMLAQRQALPPSEASRMLADQVAAVSVDDRRTLIRISGGRRVALTAGLSAVFAASAKLSLTMLQSTCRQPVGEGSAAAARRAYRRPLRHHARRRYPDAAGNGPPAGRQDGAPAQPSAVRCRHPTHRRRIWRVAAARYALAADRSRGLADPAH